jgi:hypothetical protein
MAAPARVGRSGEIPAVKGDLQNPTDFRLLSDQT